MRVTFPSRVAGSKGALLVLEVEFTSPARRVRVEGLSGVEPLDLRGDRVGGTYEVSPSLTRLHVPMRVTQDGGGEARVRVVVDDPHGGAPPETWEGSAVLDPVGGRAVGSAAWIAAAVVALLLLGVYLLGRRTPEERFPDYVGKSQEEAEALLSQAGYVVRPVYVSEDVASDVVRAQVPAAGERPPPRNGVVELTIARPLAATAPVGPVEPPAEPASALPDPPPAPTGVAVPDVVGLARADAESRLATAAIAAVVVEEDADAAQAGKVVRQEPPAGSRADPSASVVLTIGRTKATPPLVPSVVGLSQADARAALEGAGFVVEVDLVDGEPGTEGSVVAQAPVGGAEAQRGARVHLNVARAAAVAPPVEASPPPPPTEPAVPPSDPPPPSEPPPPAPPPRPAPDVLGLERRRAEDRLREAGFEVRVTFEETEDARSPVPDGGMVLRQVPRAGQDVTSGVVELVVLRRKGAATAEPAPPFDPPPPPPREPAPLPPPVEPPLPPPVEPTPPPVDPTPPAPPVERMRPVPDLTGYSEQDATMILRGQGLEAKVTYVPAQSVGSVLRQDPDFGTRVASKSTVEIFVGSAPAGAPPAPPAPPAEPVRPAEPPIETPPVDAPPVESPTPGPELPPPTVPAPPVDAAPTPPPPPPSLPAPPPPPVAPPPDRATVPDVVGRRVTDAVALALAAGVMPVLAEDPTADADRVSAQSLAASTVVPPGSAIRLSVGAPRTAGPAVAIPTLLGLTRQAAIDRLAPTGLRPETRRVSVGGPAQRGGRVIAVWPVSRAAPGAAVTLWIAGS